MLRVVNDFLAEQFHRSYHFKYATDDHPEVVLTETGAVATSALASKRRGTVRMCIVSDTHEQHRRLTRVIESIDGVDVLVHCGDINMCSRRFSRATQRRKMEDFNGWLGQIGGVESSVVIAGNHDLLLQELGVEEAQRLLSNCTYLCNTAADVGGLHFFGSPLSHGTSANAAFQSAAFRRDAVDAVTQLAQQQQQQQHHQQPSSPPSTSAVDVLLTHGFESKLQRIARPSLHIWGHFHDMYGFANGGSSGADAAATATTRSICACTLDARYDLSNPPIVLDFPCPQ